jgi:hypothetical protein
MRPRHDRPSAQTIMIGEKAADMIREDAGKAHGVAA